MNVGDRVRFQLVEYSNKYPPVWGVIKARSGNRYRVLVDDYQVLLPMNQQGVLWYVHEGEILRCPQQELFT